MVATRPGPTTVRNQALAAATRLFAEKGFGATSVQEIADMVGVTKQAILHHFPTKNRLRDAVLEAMLSHWQERLPRLLAAATASEDRFEAVLGELARFFTDDSDRARIVLRETLDRPTAIVRVLRGPVRDWVATIAEYIREGQRHGRHFADVDPEAYVIHVISMVVASAATATVTHTAVEASPAGRARFDRELHRIAKAALFSPPTPSARRRP